MRTITICKACRAPLRGTLPHVHHLPGRDKCKSLQVQWTKVPIGTAYTYQEQPICPACHKHTKHTGLSLHCPHCNGPICPHCNAHIKTTHAACVYQETKA